MKFEKQTSALKAVPKSQLLDVDVSHSVLLNIHAELSKVAEALIKPNAAESDYVRKLSRKVLSVAEAVEDEVATLDMFRDLRSDLELYDSKLDSLEESIVSQNTMGFNDTISELSSVLTRMDADNEEDTALASDLQSVLLQLGKRNLALSKKLPKSSTEKYAIVRLPIVPILNRALDAKKLERLGIEAESMEGYSILNDQVLIAVKQNYAQQWNMKPLEIAEELLVTLENNAGHKLSLVSDYGATHKGSTGFVYFWVMPDKILNKFSPLSGPIEEWGLAL